MSARWPDAWRAVPEDSAPRIARRLARGRAFERSGRVTGLRHASGMVHGTVQDDRPAGYPVDIRLPVLSEEEWDHVVAALASDVRHGARLLAGQAPDGLAQRLAAHGIVLFPPPERLACDCRDTVPWCAHVAAVWEAFARVLQEDPFALFRVLGRGRQQVLDRVAAARSRPGEPAEREAVAARPLADLRAPTDDLAALILPAPLVPAAGAGGLVAPGEAGLLRVLGDPVGWAGGVSAEALLGPLVAHAAAWAGELQT